MPVMDSQTKEALGQRLTELASLDEAISQIQQAETDGYMIPAAYGPWTAYRIILACQSMARQPATDDDERAALRWLGDHLTTAFEGNIIAESIRAGW